MSAYGGHPDRKEIRAYVTKRVGAARPAVDFRSISSFAPLVTGPLPLKRCPEKDR